jgi:hypothetical protein
MTRTKAGMVFVQRGAVYWRIYGEQALEVGLTTRHVERNQVFCRLNQVSGCLMNALEQPRTPLQVKNLVSDCHVG